KRGTRISITSLRAARRWGGSVATRSDPGLPPMRRGPTAVSLISVFPTISLGRVAGIRVGISWSWLLILALIAWSLASTVFPDQDPHLSKTAYVAMGIVAAVLYLASILLHELGHALQARREGVETDGITLWLLGGVSRFRGAFRTPAAEF